MRLSRFSRHDILIEALELVNLQISKVDHCKRRAMLLDKKKVIQQMLDELPHYLPKTPRYEMDRGDNRSRHYQVYIGTISGWKCESTYDKKSCFVDQVTFSIERGSNLWDSFATELNVVVHPMKDLGDEWLLSGKYDKERHERYDMDLDTAIKFTVDNRMMWLVDMEWLEPYHDSHWREVAIPNSFFSKYRDALKYDDPEHVGQYWEIPQNTRLLTRRVKYPDRRVMEIRLDSGVNELYLTARLLDRHGKELTASECYLYWPHTFTLEYQGQWYKAFYRGVEG